MSAVGERSGRPAPSVARNALLNLVGQAAPLMVAIVAVPSIVSGLGTARFGLLSLAWVIFGYFGMFDFGLSRATTKVVSESLGRSEVQHAAEVVGTSLLLQLCLGVAGGAALAICAAPLVEGILDVPAQVAPEATALLVALASGIPPLLLTVSLRGVLEACQRFGLVNVVRAPQTAANFLLPLAGVTFGWSLVHVAWLLSAAQYVAAIAYYRMCVRTAPSLMDRRGFVASAWRLLMNYGRWVTVSQFAGPMLIYIDRFVLGALAPVATIAYYVAPFEMVNRLLFIPSSLVAALFPAFSFLGKTSGREIEMLAIRSIKYLLLGMGLVVAVLAANAHAILRVWLGPEFADTGAIVVQILAVGTLINAGAQVHYAVLQAIGRADLTAKIHALELPVMLVLATLLISWKGMVGAAIAWTLRIALDAAMLATASHRLNIVRLHRYRSERLTLSISWVCAVAMGASAVSAANGSQAARTGLLFILLTAAGLGIWRYVFDDEDRARIAGLLSQRLG